MKLNEGNEGEVGTGGVGVEVEGGDAKDARGGAGRVVDFATYGQYDLCSLRTSN